MAPIQVPDAHRFLFGDAAPSFLIEVALRLLVLYVVLATSIRFMGRRTSSELTRNEILAIVALAAAIGPPMQAPDRGLIPPIMIAIWVVLWQRGIAAATFHSRRIEHLMHGRGTTLLESGTMQLAALKASAVSRERLMAELRTRAVLQLGQVERVYLEADGAFTVVERGRPKSGLSIVPIWDQALRSEQPEDATASACAACGALHRQATRPRRCTQCGAETWAAAVSSELLGSTRNE
jgi:uncharacterized membrane protein YcaP (DUF421 family)